MSSVFEAVSTTVVTQNNTSALELGKSWSINLSQSDHENILALNLAKNGDLRSNIGLNISLNNDSDVANFISAEKLNKVDSSIRGQQVLYFEHLEKNLTSDVETYNLGTVSDFKIELDENLTNPFATGNLKIVSTYVSNHSTPSDGKAQYTISIPDSGEGDLFRARNHRRNIHGDTGSSSYTSDLSGFKIEPNSNFNTNKTGFNPNEYPIISTNTSDYGKA